MAALYVKACTGLLIVFFLSGIHIISSQQQADLFITTPKKMEALSGSCVQIPCNFSARGDVMFNGTENPVGVWLKNDHPLRPQNVIFNGSLTDNLYQVEIPGDLRQKNCTTIFYNLNTDNATRYFFRVESSQFRATAIDDPFEITITDSPPTPITNNNNISTPQQKEGDVATFTCSAIAPCPAYPPVLRWSPPWDAGTQTQLEVNSTDRTVTARSQVTLTLAEEHDGVNVSCSVSYPVNGTESNFKTTNKTLLRLNVTYSPKRTSASISPADGLVSVGSWVNFTCTSTAKPPVHSFIWFKTSNDGPTTNVSVGDFYSLNVSSADDGGAYHCEATNDLGTQASAKVLLHIKVTHPDDYMLSSQAIIGGITGITLVICLVVFITWWLHSRRSAVPQTQSQVVGEPANQNTDEEIHYGEIDFSKMQPGSLQVKQPEPDTEYAEVKAGQPAPASSSVTANEPNDDLYSQVKH